MSATGGADDRDMTYAARLWPTKGAAPVEPATEDELREALEGLSEQHTRSYDEGRKVVMLHAAITELMALRADVDNLAQNEREDQRDISELTLENARLRAALAPVEDDYPAEVFRELWRVLGELRAATGEEGRA